jgi:hypothetical protein
MDSLSICKATRALSSCTNLVVIRLNAQGIVKKLNSNIYLINLEERTCSRLIYQENKMPYKHAIIAILAI